MPKTAALVNGQAISSLELESQVIVIQENHKIELANLPASAPADLRIGLVTSTAKIHNEALDTIIQENLLLQESIKNGQFISETATQSYMQTLLTSLQQEPRTSFAYTKFIAYLCANNIAETDFVKNKTLIHIYQNSLMVAAARSSFLQTFPPEIRSNPDKVKTAMANYIESLRKQASIQILLPNRFLSNQ